MNLNGIAFNCHRPTLCASSLIHSIATRVIKLAHAKSSIALAPALVETYSRLLVYMEIESLGIKGFISEFHFIKNLHSVKKVLFTSDKERATCNLYISFQPQIILFPEELLLIYCLNNCN